MVPQQSTVAMTVVLLSAMACTPPARRSPPPRPTVLHQDGDSEERNSARRRAWIEHIHRTAPDIDWQSIERENGRAEQQRRNRLAATAGGTSHWSEVGSSNLAGRTHAADLSPDGQKLYVGSSLGGVWRGNPDGSGWEPLGDNLYGGAHEVRVLPGENAGEPDVIVVTTDYGLVHVSRDEGLSWEEPPGTEGLTFVRGVAVLTDPAKTILLYASGPSTGDAPTVLASTDYGRTFSGRWQGTAGWLGWMWAPRTGPGSANQVYVVDDGRVRMSTDAGFTFPQSVEVKNPSTRGVITGSEAGAPVVYVAIQGSGQWELFRSDDAGQSFVFKHVLTDFFFFESLGSSIFDTEAVFYGGIQCYRSHDGGTNFSLVNPWDDYYDDPAGMLHADIQGIHCWPDPQSPGQEVCYISTDGGTYVSHDYLATVENLSLSGLAVGQYYSTLSSTTDWDRVSAGSQDQGYQLGTVLHADGAGPSTPLDQIIAGDWGHLTSNDGTHQLVFSTYPFNILVQDGPVDPSLYLLDHPTGATVPFLPAIAADPTIPGTFYFASERLYRYERISESEWAYTLHSLQRFGGPTIDGDYMSALAFAPTDPETLYAVNDQGLLFYSTDHGVTWTESADQATTGPFFYGHAIAVHPADSLEVAVGGSGYSAPGVIRSIDGGQSWFAETDGLPPTLVYALTYARDGSGDLYAGTETGAYRWNRGTGLWENIMANDAPATIYWSVEPVNDGGTLRYGTYGRGIWDYATVAGDRDGDGVPDDQDLCANNDDPDQLDGDGDGAGDVCDNCATVVNVDQANADGDAAGDVCDCAPQASSVFAVPPEVAGLAWSSKELLQWESVIPLSGVETEHKVFRGELGEFPVGSTTDCTVSPTQDSALIDTDLPVSGSGFWYLVHGTNSCGVGSLGSWGAGSERTIPFCL